MEKKECTVIMLATDKTDGMLWETTSRQLIHTHVSGKFKNEYKPFNLYIVDDSEIKGGDWYIEKTGIGWFVPTIAKQEDINVEAHISRCKKIIATTDSELEVTNQKDSILLNNLPQIPQIFIAYYCKNPVDKVVVEYNRTMDGTPTYNKIALTSDNCIITHPVKEKMYTQSEVDTIRKEEFQKGVECLINN